MTAESLRRFDEDDLELAIELGRRAGVAIENARLYERQAATAAVLQRSLMPAEIPKIQGFEAHAMYRPAGPDDIVGGDFYDAFRVPGGWTLLVGDIAGKGIQAAALTAQARHVLRSNTMFTGDVVQAVTHLNRLLVADEKLSLCTICAVVLPDDPGASPARVLCAGHPPPGSRAERDDHRGRQQRTPGRRLRGQRLRRRRGSSCRAGTFWSSTPTGSPTRVALTAGWAQSDSTRSSPRPAPRGTPSRSSTRRSRASSMAPRPTTPPSSRSSAWPSPTAGSGRSAADPAPVRARLGRWAYRLVTITERRCS